MQERHEGCGLEEMEVEVVLGLDEQGAPFEDGLGAEHQRSEGQERRIHLFTVDALKERRGCSECTLWGRLRGQRKFHGGQLATGLAGEVRQRGGEGEKA